MSIAKKVVKKAVGDFLKEDTVLFDYRVHNERFAPEVGR
jgi:hypothetical protein